MPICVHFCPERSVSVSRLALEHIEQVDWGTLGLLEADESLEIPYRCFQLLSPSEAARDEARIWIIESVSTTDTWSGGENAAVPLIGWLIKMCEFTDTVTADVVEVCVLRNFLLRYMT